MEHEIEYEIGDIVRYKKLIIDGKWSRIIETYGRILEIDGIQFHISDQWVPLKDIILKQKNDNTRLFHDL